MKLLRIQRIVEIDDDVYGLVKFFNKNKFVTIGSCSGHKLAYGNFCDGYIQFDSLVWPQSLSEFIIKHKMQNWGESGGVHQPFTISVRGNECFLVFTHEDLLKLNERMGFESSE